MFDSNGHLLIFERFETDWNLPKHKRAMEKEEDSENSMMKSSSPGRIRISPFPSFSVVMNEDREDDNFTVKMATPSSSKGGFWRRLKEHFQSKPKSPGDWGGVVLEPESTLSIQRFFQSVKNSAEELKLVIDRANSYEKALKKAQSAGQTALFEQLAKGLVAVRAESQLLAIGLGKYVEEAKIVEFAKQAKKGLRLDWVANYTGIIPDELVTKKLAADERFVFDNYVVLHYDPGLKSWAETEAEKKKRQDPILFGVMEGRRRLYFIGDWVNELCDLTLDQIADALGKGSIGTIPVEVEGQPVLTKE